MTRSKVLAGVAAVLVLCSVIAGWIAVGHLAEATKKGLARTQEALSTARDLATNTAQSATELQNVVGLVGEGLGHTSDALVATRQVSSNVRELLDKVSFINSVDDLSSSLQAAEATIADVEVSLDEAAGAIDEAVPVLGTTVDSLQAIPAQLDVSISEVEASEARIGEQVWLWRLAMCAGGAALLVMLALIFDLQRAVARPATDTGVLEVQP